MNPQLSLPHHAFPFLVPRANPDDQADRAGDTLSGKTGRRTKEGEQALRCHVLGLYAAPTFGPKDKSDEPCQPH